MAATDLSAERLRELLSYDSETGVFTRKTCVGGEHIGDVAGSNVRTSGKDGHVRQLVGIDGKIYLAHRLAWLHVYGCWPNGEIDHIDCNTLNNTIANLRESSRGCNAENRRLARVDSTSGLLGVMINKKRWQASIRVSGKRVYLGTFDTPEEAHARYVTAKRELHAGCTI